MADNVEVDNGAEPDYIVSTDEAASGHVQRMKLAYSANGVDTHAPVDADGVLVNLGANNDVTITGTATVTVGAALPAGTNNIGDVDVLSLPAMPAGNNNIGDVDVASSVLPTGASTLAEQQTQTASLSVLDDWDESDRAKVNPIAGQAGVQGASGTVTALTQRVVLATDVALPAGANAIGKLAANTGVDIGDVDVTSIVPGTAATNLGKAEDATHNSGDTGVYVLAVRDTSPAAHAGSDNEYESLHVSDEGGLWSAEVASSQGGCDAFFTYDADETEEDVKTSAGTVYGWYIYNDAAAEVFVRLYNATAANTTVGSTAAKIVLAIPAGSAANMSFTPGIRFDTAICIAATTLSGASDATAPAASQVCATIFYK